MLCLRFKAADEQTDRHHTTFYQLFVHVLIFREKTMDDSLMYIPTMMNKIPRNDKANTFKLECESFIVAALLIIS